MGGVMQGGGHCRANRFPMFQNLETAADNREELRCAGWTSEQSAARVDPLLGVDVGPEGELFNSSS